MRLDSATTQSPNVYLKDTIEKGVPKEIECVDIEGQTYGITRTGFVSILGLENDWFEDIRDPESVIRTLRDSRGIKADIFTFWQRMPDIAPRYDYYMETEDIAVLPVTSYEHWLKHQIKSRVRNLVRKAEKEGIEVRETTFDDDFVRGMTKIFNESPIRQGRRFWHYGKDFETVKQQFSRFIHREYMIGAYHRNEMIGLIMMGNAGRFALTGQIISSLEHRDKNPNNALIAKAVEVCARRGLEYLIYLFWSEDSLAEFKRRNGFEKTAVPRYFVPLTARGRIAMKCGAHHGLKNMIPLRLKTPIKKLRRMWNDRRGSE